MSVLSRAGMCLLIVAGVLVGAGLALGALVPQLDPWGLLLMGDRLSYEREREEWLASQQGDALVRVDLKRRLVHDLAAGRRTLAEAVSEFRQLDQERPEFAELMRMRYPGWPGEEGIYRCLLAWAQTERLPDLAARLRAELGEPPADPALIPPPGHRQWHSHPRHGRQHSRHGHRPSML